MPQGIVDFVSTVLDKTPTSAALFGIFRHERHGLIDDEARRRMRLIIPHVRRAVLIGKVIDLKTAEAANLADTLDGIAAGMFLVDSRGQVVHANAAGHAILAHGDMVTVTSTGDLSNGIQALCAGVGGIVLVNAVCFPRRACAMVDARNIERVVCLMSETAEDLEIQRPVATRRAPKNRQHKK